MRGGISFRAQSLARSGHGKQGSFSLFFTELPHRHDVVSSPTFPVFSQYGGPGDGGQGRQVSLRVTASYGMSPFTLPTES